jgi:hypothetical protein
MATRRPQCVWPPTSNRSCGDRPPNGQMDAISSVATPSPKWGKIIVDFIQWCAILIKWVVFVICSQNTSHTRKLTVKNDGKMLKVVLKHQPTSTENTVYCCHKFPSICLRHLLIALRYKAKALWIYAVLLVVSHNNWIGRGKKPVFGTSCPFIIWVLVAICINILWRKPKRRFTSRLYDAMYQNTMSSCSRILSPSWS